MTPQRQYEAYVNVIFVAIDGLRKHRVLLSHVGLQKARIEPLHVVRSYDLKFLLLVFKMRPHPQPRSQTLHLVDWLSKEILALHHIELTRRVGSKPIVPVRVNTSESIGIMGIFMTPVM